jgi:hypothetical protein
MRKMMDSALARYGTAAILQNAAGSQTVNVFFHSINSTSWQNMDREFSPLGEIPRGQYVCILPAHVQIAAEDTLLIGDRAYLVRKAEQMDLFSGPIYYWALCVEKGCEDAWDEHE